MTTAPKIESRDLNLEDLFKDFYSVPDFQREYVWESKNVTKLLEDMLDEFSDESGNISREPDEYFIGSIVTFRNPDSGTFELIDGQQRLTTSYLVLCAIRDCLAEVGQIPMDNLKSQIFATQTEYTTGEDIPRYRLDLQYEDSDGVLEKIAKGQPAVREIPETTASVRNIIAAYQTIREFLTVSFSNDHIKVKRFYGAFTSRIKLIRIVTPNLTHALKIFETINDRGVGLNAMDLLKNLLFIKTDEQDYPKLKQRWKVLSDLLDQKEKPLRFLRYYIMSHYEIDWAKGLREDQIYEWFGNHTKDTGIDNDPLGFVNELVSCAEAYAYFIAGKDFNGIANVYLQNIGLLTNDAARQHFILLLAGRHLPTDIFNQFCREIECLFFCYIITREATKNFERSFARWSKDVRAVKDADGLKAFLNKTFYPDMRNRSSAFDFAFSELSLSRIQKYRMRYILAKFTQFVENQAGRSVPNLDPLLTSKVHIEHILPQTPTTELRASFDKSSEYDSYVSRLGNLMLLERPINVVASNGWYDEKKTVYRQSGYLLARSLAEKPQVGINSEFNRGVADLLQFDLWNSVSIDQRQEMLSRLARRIWLPGINNEMKTV